MRRKTSKHPRGLTLIEYLVGLALLGILAGIALPAFSGLRLQMTGSAYTNAFMASVWLTRSEAVKRRHRVTMCVSADGLQCQAGGAWSEGWIVFLDANANGFREPEETIIATQEAFRHGWAASGNLPVQWRISYVATGHSRLIGGGFQAGTVTFCPPHGQALSGSRVIINSTGRPRTEKTLSPNC